MSENAPKAKPVCAACPDFLEQRDLLPGDFCRVHWATIEVAVPNAGFHCEHHDHN